MERKGSSSASVVQKLTQLADQDDDGRKLLSDEMIKNLYDHEDLANLEVLESSEYSLANLDGEDATKDELMDQSIKMLCEQHKQPAAFFSHQHNRYMCFKCLIAENQLLFIDKSYKSEMDEFLRIRKLTQEAIQSNAKHLDIVPKWKSEIRSRLLFSRKAFNERIERYVDKFSD